MQNQTITSLTNLLVKQVRSLRQKKARLKSGTFLVEGIHHVGEAVEAGWSVQSVLYAPDVLTSKFAHDLIHRLPFAPQEVSLQVMKSLADKENPQGILAVVRQKRMKISDVDVSKMNRVVALVSPQDPGNVGTILRTMDAVEADTLFLLDGGVDLYHPTVVRSSMGTLFWRPIVQASFKEFVSWAKDEGVQLIGTSAHGSVDYQSFTPQRPWALILGNEQKGLLPDQVAACDVTISLPMKGRVSSLNLSVAASIMLYQFS